MGVNFFLRNDRDVKFLLFEHLGVEKLLAYEAYRDLSTDDFNMIIDEALKVGRNTLGPANQNGDREGVVYDNGEVKVPAAFHDCWKVLAENGWMAVSNSPEFGGQGLPACVGAVISEFFLGANFGMMSYPGLAVGNGRLIETFGTDEDKALFVEKMYTGIWGGTMCLTEPNAGSDVGALKTKAVKDLESDDPRVYKIEGVKQFISAGKHDLVKNIIHLVLARIEGAPAGTKGLSLFIVPEIWVNSDGFLDRPNDVLCRGVEHKMGIHGASTCTLGFGENGQCRGILLGEPHSGMKKMFQMMNEARLGTGLMAHALAASAYDSALQYAKERVQGAHFTKPKGEAVSIIQHEDVRRMLMNLKAGTEGMRAMICKTYYLIDVSEKATNEDERKTAHLQVELLTPMVKAYCSDFSYNLIRDAIQILGGVGYCSEFPVEQYARDCKINSIWEGTNYLQAMDLIARKLPMQGGKVFQEWIQKVTRFTSQHQEDPDFAKDFKLLFKAAQILGEFALTYSKYFQEGKGQLIPLSATRFLDCFAEVFMGQLMLEQGLIARAKLKDVNRDSTTGMFYRGKIASAKYFCRNILVNVFSRHIFFKQEDTTALDIPEEAF